MQAYTPPALDMPSIPKPPVQAYTISIVDSLIDNHSKVTSSIHVDMTEVQMAGAMFAMRCLSCLDGGYSSFAPRVDIGHLTPLEVECASNEEDEADSLATRVLAQYSAGPICGAIRPGGDISAIIMNSVKVYGKECRYVAALEGLRSGIYVAFDDLELIRGFISVFKSLKVDHSKYLAYLTDGKERFTIA